MDEKQGRVNKKYVCSIPMNTETRASIHGFMSIETTLISQQIIIMNKLLL